MALLVLIPESLSPCRCARDLRPDAYPDRERRVSPCEVFKHNPADDAVFYAPKMMASTTSRSIWCEGRRACRSPKTGRWDGPGTPRSRRRRRLQPFAWSNLLVNDGDPRRVHRRWVPRRPQAATFRPTPTHDQLPDWWRLLLLWADQCVLRMRTTTAPNQPARTAAGNQADGFQFHQREQNATASIFPVILNS